MFTLSFDEYGVQAIQMPHRSATQDRTASEFLMRLAPVVQDLDTKIRENAVNKGEKRWKL